MYQETGAIYKANNETPKELATMLRPHRTAPEDFQNL